MSLTTAINTGINVTEAAMSWSYAVSVRTLGGELSVNSGSLSPPEAIVSLSMGFSRFSFTTSSSRVFFYNPFELSNCGLPYSTIGSLKTLEGVVDAHYIGHVLMMTTDYSNVIVNEYSASLFYNYTAVPSVCLESSFPEAYSALTPLSTQTYTMMYYSSTTGRYYCRGKNHHRICTLSTDEHVFEWYRHQRFEQLKPQKVICSVLACFALMDDGSVVTIGHVAGTYIYRPTKRDVNQYGCSAITNMSAGHDSVYIWGACDDNAIIQCSIASCEKILEPASEAIVTAMDGQYHTTVLTMA
eukprot:TRINITY_DN4836_c0_g1_i1.p1 TRINITY_DN4836_c0_g1~~TRINITY_DN4836_c0_g1_i1.p1  ORF type:complete len:306 (+),score=20.43 TRINITY_DN4836_c0_g1_i1:24-920(+)